MPTITDPAVYSFSSPNSGVEAEYERNAVTKMFSHLPVERPHVAFVSSTAQTALGTLDQVARVAGYRPSVAYPGNGLALALKAVAGAMSSKIGTNVFWVQIGGFDTHAGQGTNQGTYANLMATVDESVSAFFNDLDNQRLLASTMVVVFSEFGIRINENSGVGSDHGAGGLMLVLGGMVRGGLYGTAADLRQDPANPTLENNTADVHYETDFRSVYAKIIDGWLGGDSTVVLQGDFRAGAPTFS